MKKETTEYKEGDIVKIKGFKSPGIIIEHKGNRYDIKPLFPCSVKIVNCANIIVYFEPKTCIKKMNVPVEVISPINKQEE